ncbi:MAG: ABC transporter substrate-binding protein [Syntrophomonadaceae bacterium]|nr:ABC transporter substrate-binding protein [Syntrophomonadaceae bacterium]
MKNLSIYKVTGLCMVLILSIFMAGCQSSQKAATNNAGNQTGNSVPSLFDIRFAHSTAIIGIDSFWVAQELGFDKEENINLVDVGAISNNELPASILAGQIDVAGKHVNRLVAAINAGAKLKAVVASTETSKEIPHMSFATKVGSGISTAQDFKGKKIGLTTYGGCMDGTPNAWLKKNGIADPKSFYEVVVLPTEAKLMQALDQGDVDIVGIHKDYDWIENYGGIKVIFTDYDVWETLGGACPYYFSQNFIDQHPDEIKRFVKVMAKTHNWINQNLEQAREITARKANTDVKNIGKYYYATDGVIDPASVQVWIDIMTETGEIKSGIKVEDVYTNEFNDYAKKS